MKPKIVVLSAPSNLGLMPPAPGQEPGVRRMAAALKELGLLAQLGAWRLRCWRGRRASLPATARSPDARAQ